MSVYVRTFRKNFRDNHKSFCNFFFMKFKLSLKGRSFDDSRTIKGCSCSVLNTGLLQMISIMVKGAVAELVASRTKGYIPKGTAWNEVQGQS
jgi:hypothetical protein